MNKNDFLYLSVLPNHCQDDWEMPKILNFRESITSVSQLGTNTAPLPFEADSCFFGASPLFILPACSHPT